MKTGINYSFFRLHPVLIRVYKIWEVLYFSYLYRSRIIRLDDGTFIHTYLEIRLKSGKKNVLSFDPNEHGLKEKFTGSFFDRIIMNIAYLKYLFDKTFPGRFGVPHNPFDRIWYSRHTPVILKSGLISIGNNRIYFADRIKLKYHIDQLTSPVDDLEMGVDDDFENLNIASSFIRTAGERVTAGARLILGLRVRAAAGMALTSFLPAAVPFFNQTQFVQKTATAVLLGGSSWPFCRLGLFGPFTSPVGGLFSFNRNSLYI